ncbi:MAG: carbon starvation protein A [Phycisphaerales bacterium]|nr:carbon starvation protein A [Phycisphaerales bacterium]
MSLPLLTLGVMAALAAGYLVYGRFIARQYQLSDGNETPAERLNDGVDFVPTRPFYLLGQHFSAIAAAGPIVGPITACAAFGWGPCLLWILLGVIFIGAVHDFSALVASVRHGATSIAEIARTNLGPRAWLCLSAFIWIALLYVIAAFADVTAQSFLGRSEEVEGISGTFNRGGAVAAASTMYLGLALVMGLVMRFVKPPMWLATLIFVPATLLAIWGGTRVSDVLVLPAKTWYVIILGYCLAASMLPMWLLQQPRGYLGGFVLYLAIGVGTLGILFGGFSIEQPAFAKEMATIPQWLRGGAEAPGVTQLLFPFLFVTIACGACSGFHGLVCGGTTCRQIAKESHCKPVAFGGMLLEGFVAVIALATVMIVAPGSEASKTSPSTTYGNGLARFMVALAGGEGSPGLLLFAMTFGTMAVATFIFDTIDVATRLGRYLLQEITGRKGPLGGLAAAGLTAGLPLVFLLSSEAGSWRAFWTLFGTSNQLLASLTLLGVTVWLVREGRRCWYVVAPMVFVMAITAAALALQIGDGVRSVRLHGGLVYEPRQLNAWVALVLAGLAAVYVVDAVLALGRALRARRGRGKTGPV